MNYYYLFKNNKQAGWTILHAQCVKDYPLTPDTVMICGEAIKQPRTPCRSCGKLLDEVAAKKVLAKRALEKPLRDLEKMKIKKVGKNQYSLSCGKDVLKKDTELEEIKKYLLTEFKPDAKIKPQFEEKLFEKFFSAK